MGNTGCGKTKLAEAIALNSGKHIFVASTHPDEILLESVTCNRTNDVLGELEYLAFNGDSIQRHFWIFDDVPALAGAYPEAATFLQTVLQSIAVNAAPAVITGKSPLFSDWGLLRSESLFFVNVWIGESAYIGVDQLLMSPAEKKQLKSDIYTRSRQDPHYALLSVPRQDPQILDLYASTPSVSGLSLIY